MSSPYRLSVQVPLEQIEDFFIWLDQHCAGWTGYRDDDQCVSFIVVDPVAIDRITDAWPVATLQKIPLE